MFVKTGVYVNCEYCGKETYKTQTHMKRNTHHFCSFECYQNYTKENSREYRKCKVCNDEFYVLKSSTQELCSYECRYEFYKTLVGIKNIKFKRIEVICRNCGKKHFVKRYAVNENKDNFCSNECQREWYKNFIYQTEEYKEKRRNIAIDMLQRGIFNRNSSSIQIIINSLLDNISVKYTNEEKFVYYAVDNYLIDYNLIIEVMGDYWHSNPNKYSDFNKLNNIQKDRIGRDISKNTYIKNHYGIYILYLWESDINKTINVCEKLIKEYIKNKGVLDSYNSFNYSLDNNNNLMLNNNLTIPYQKIV